MDNKQIEEIYSDLLGYYREDWPFGYPGRRAFLMREIFPERITSLLKELPLNNNLRADARYLLVLLFNQMLIEPLAISWSRSGRFVGQEFLDDVKSDLGDIVSTANSITVEGFSKRNTEIPSAAISGHSVLLAINQQWKKLRLAGKKYWDDENDSGLS